MSLNGDYESGRTAVGAGVRVHSKPRGWGAVHTGGGRNLLLFRRKQKRQQQYQSASAYYEKAIGICEENAMINSAAVFFAYDVPDGLP